MEAQSLYDGLKAAFLVDKPKPRVFICELKSQGLFIYELKAKRRKKPKDSCVGQLKALKVFREELLRIIWRKISSEIFSELERLPNK